VKFILIKINQSNNKIRFQFQLLL